MTYRKICIKLCALAASAMLVACGGGSGSTTASTGVFLDSAVDGVSYSTATQSGVTSGGGMFTYIVGETVTFSVGSITLPTVTAGAKITPFDIAGSTDINNDKVVNILVFLQSIDNDGDPSNGITITEATRNSATTALDFSKTKAEFRAQTALTNIVVAARGSGAKAVSEAAAAAHFKTTIAAEGITTSITESTAVLQQRNATIVTTSAIVIF